MQVFWRQGYEATSINDLTAAMDINPPSLYAAFGDKERLFLEAVVRYRSAAEESITRTLEGAATARDGVERLLEYTARETTKSGRPAGCMMITSTMNCSAGSAHLHSALAEHRAATGASIKTRIQRGVREGELPADTDTGALARFYETVIQGMTIQARDGVSRKCLRAVGKAAMRAWPVLGSEERHLDATHL
jgi:AcrR family transcriptional regulator